MLHLFYCTHLHGDLILGLKQLKQFAVALIERLHCFFLPIAGELRSPILLPLTCVIDPLPGQPFRGSQPHPHLE